MYLHSLRFLSFVLPCLVGVGIWTAPAQANPYGSGYSTIFPLAGQVVDGTTVIYGNPVAGTVLTNSGYYYSSPYIYGGRQYRQHNSGVSNSVLVNPIVVNSPIRNSTLINPTIVNSGYYPAVPVYPADSYYPHYFNPPIYTIQTYTRPSPEVIVDPEYGVRFKNPPGY